MNFSQFIGQVQHRLELPGEGEALRGVRGVLTTLGERLQPGEASDLAAPLPMEIDRFLLTADSGQRFDYDEFLNRVTERVECDRSEAAYQSQVVIAVVSEIVPETELDQVRAQLPDGYASLFELIQEGEGSTN